MSYKAKTNHLINSKRQIENCNWNNHPIDKWGGKYALRAAIAQPGEKTGFDTFVCRLDRLVEPNSRAFDLIGKFSLLLLQGVF